MRGEQREMWLENGVVNARFTGDDGAGQVVWSVDAARAQGLGVFATAPAASGQIDIARAGEFRGTAQLALANAALTPEAQQNLPQRHSDNERRTNRTDTRSSGGRVRQSR